MKKKLLLFAAIAIHGFATCTFAQPVPSYVPTNGLIGWWPFNGNANDESGNGNNGTVYGTMLTTDRYGRVDSAYSFDGSASYISIPSSASLESPTCGLSLNAWVNLAGFSLVGQPFCPILMKSDNAGNAFMYRFEINLNGIGFYAGVNNWTNNTGVSNAFSLNQWYMVTAVLDSFVSTFYIDGGYVGTQSFTTVIANNTLPLEIGRDVPGYTEVFNGKLDDIGIWNRPLSALEVADLYASINVGIKKTETAKQLTIYPNPALNEIHVMSDSKLNGSSYFISNTLGKIVLSGKLNQEITKISIDDLSPGMYVLQAGDHLKQAFTVIEQ